MAIVKLNTSLGSIQLELDEQATPKTTQNFLNYVKEGFYNGTLFHRVIKGFMIQGGGFEPGMTQKTGHTPIPNEAKTGLKNEIGTISMARTSDPHSASSQFFINVANNQFLNFQKETPDAWGYCAFGRVTDGLDVINKISQAATGRAKGHDDVPIEDVYLLDAEVISE
jgi:peptidyl-prolyl cis-trans isomerase B (cyclophilin B)